MDAVNIRAATVADYQQVVALLQSENLPVSDLSPELSHFFVAVNENEIVAAIGLEYYDQSALLRSMVTAPPWRNHGLATALIDKLFEYAKSKAVNKIYIITNTAEKYFSQKAFNRIDRSLVDEAVLSSEEFNGLCPSTASIMYRHI